MLSRVADALYWMSRFMERADNVARLVEMNLQLMFDLQSVDADKFRSNWLPVVQCLGVQNTFKKSALAADCDAVIEFLVFQPDHPGSIHACLRSARENARSIREQISDEMWEQINRAWLWMNGKAARQLFLRTPYDFFQKIREESQLFQGLTDATMPHEEGWRFIQLGKYLERADKTSRLLDEKFHLSNKRYELLQWASILRGCSARQAYQKKYVAAVNPNWVAELLLLDRSFPRSVEFCAAKADLSLRRLSGVPDGKFCNAAEKLSGRLLADLSFSTIEDHLARGLHASVDALQGQLNAIDAAVYDAYIGQKPEGTMAPPPGFQSGAQQQ